MTKPRPRRGQAAPPPVTAKALMEDLNALYARIKEREQEEDRAWRKARRARGKA